MKSFKNTAISVLLAVLIPVTGNFAVAFMHLQCRINDSSHSTCEMECCAEDSCCEVEDESAVKITDENGSCCETHIEQAVEQDNAVLVINNPGDNLKYSVRTFTLCSDNILCSEGFSEITHKFKTTNIPIEFSNLRI